MRYQDQVDFTWESRHQLRHIRISIDRERKSKREGPVMVELTMFGKICFTSHGCSSDAKGSLDIVLTLVVYWSNYLF